MRDRLLGDCKEASEDAVMVGAVSMALNPLVDGTGSGYLEASSSSPQGDPSLQNLQDSPAAMSLMFFETKDIFHISILTLCGVVRK